MRSSSLEVFRRCFRRLLMLVRSAEYDVYMEYLNQQQAELCELTDEETSDAEPVNFEDQLEAEAD